MKDANFCQTAAVIYSLFLLLGRWVLAEPGEQKGWERDRKVLRGRTWHMQPSTARRVELVRSLFHAQ